MKRTAYKRSSAFTLAEMAVSMGVLSILGLVFLEVLRSALVLSAKNTAVNTAHEEAREGILRLTRDIHASISVPQLRDANFNVVSSVPTGTQAPMAPGVSFQTIAFGPQFVWKEPGNSSWIMVKGGPNNLSPTPGMHLVAPFYAVEDDIIKVTASPTTANHHNILLQNGGETLLANKTSTKGAVGATYSIIYYTNRVAYVVKNGNYVADNAGDWFLSGGVYVPYTNQSGQRYHYENGELHLYTQGYNGTAFYWNDTATVAKYISNPRPFYIPLVPDANGVWYDSASSNLSFTTSSSGSPGNRFSATCDDRYVGVKLTTRDPKSTNRGYIATASLLNTQVDYRSRIAISQ